MSVVGEPLSGGRLLYKGTSTTFTAKGLRNDVEYRFVLIAFDRAGNSSTSVVVSATPRALLLARPKPSEKVVAPPLLRWTPVAGAAYFNVQLYRGRAKILSSWPNLPRLQLGSAWTYDTRKYRLTPGTYTWYVWPGLGARAEARYGQLLGKSTFVVTAGKAAKKT